MLYRNACVVCHDPFTSVPVYVYAFGSGFLDRIHTYTPPLPKWGWGRTSTAKNKLTHSPEVHQPVHGWKTTAASVLGRKSPVNIYVSALEAVSTADTYSMNK